MKIIIGDPSEPLFTFDDNSIFSLSSSQKVSLIAEILYIDTMTASVKDDASNLRDIYHFRSLDGYEITTANTQIYAIDVGKTFHVSPLIDVPYGTPVWAYDGDTLLSKFYFDSADRIGQNRYTINCVSAIGLLDKMEDEGGMFRSMSFEDVLWYIMRDTAEAISYSIDSDVKTIPVNGWLPKAKKRENLHQLLLANGINIVKNADGGMRFTFIYAASGNPPVIDEKQIYMSGSVKYEKPYSSVTVTEHTYIANQTENAVTLFDNAESSPVTNTTVWFSNAPIIESTLEATSGLTIVETLGVGGCNGAVVSGSGKLTGIPYTHNTRELTAFVQNGASEKTAKVDRCTMVSAINSSNLLNRLKAYYQPNGAARTISDGVIYDGLRNGKAYAIKDPFMEPETAFLTSMNIRVSGKNKAECVWRANYTPAGQASLFKSVILIAPGVEEDIIVLGDDSDSAGTYGYSGDWQVPVGVTEIKVVIISGGTGGGSGWPGQNGKDAEVSYISSGGSISGLWYGAEGGEGGAGGPGGAPGRVKIIELSNLTAGTVFHWSIGVGGAGGDATGFIPDTEEELKAALDNEQPGWERTNPTLLTDTLAYEQTLSDWDGSPINGNAGSATTFGSYSTDDGDAYTPSDGVYEPINGWMFATRGGNGINGGKGGARKIKQESGFVWVTTGEDVSDGTQTYSGGLTGEPASRSYFTAYGGNGAGAAVGIGTGYQGINGSNAQAPGRPPLDTVYAGQSGGHNYPRLNSPGYYFSYLPSPAANATQYGCGGNGGHGGGGGAGAARIIVQGEDTQSLYHIYGHGYGSGGGKGGKGGDGCILIYY